MCLGVEKELVMLRSLIFWKFAKGEYTSDCCEQFHFATFVWEER